MSREESIKKFIRNQMMKRVEGKNYHQGDYEYLIQMQQSDEMLIYLLKEYADQQTKELEEEVERLNNSINELSETIESHRSDTVYYILPKLRNIINHSQNPT